MNDSELITAVRESVTGVHTATPVEQIVTRGRAVRARRRIPALAGAMAAVAAAVFAVTALLPGLRPASHRSGTQLAAWTVVKQADGNVRVTLRDLRDPAGLQGKLRADGVPVSVTFLGQPDPACQMYPPAVQMAHFPAVVEVPAFPFPTTPGGTIVVIHPSALPRHAGLHLVARFAPDPHHGAGTLVAVGGLLVHASQQCTGS
jgi:hypothetical protein